MDNCILDVYDINDNLKKFWNSFETWHNKSDVVEELFKAEYTEYNNWDRGYFYLNIDYENEYRDYYGISFPIAHQGETPSFEQIVDYIVIAYARWIKTDKRYSYTIEVNNRFEKFGLPYRLSAGQVTNKSYKTTEKIGKIINYRMFERKIQFAEENILRAELLDKKVALDYLIDALQFLISVQDANNVEKKKICAASLVSDNKDGKVYAVIKKEIEEIMTISNEYFDIRHNEYLNKAKQIREPLEDSGFIEYLYNRAYALLYILRLRTNIKDLITEGEVKVIGNVN